MTCNLIIRRLEIDHSPFLKRVMGFSKEDWHLDRTRKPKNHFAHDTLSIRENINDRFDNVFSEFREMTTPLFDELYGKSEWKTKVYLLSLAYPGGGIKIHVDQAENHQYMRRMHIPITTNGGAVSIFPNETKKKIHMPLGGLYEFNFRKPHRTENTGDTDRIHLVMDVYTNTKNEWLQPSC